MVGSTEVFDALKSIGLNLYERKIFVALLAKGVASAAELSEIANVPRSRSYDILESLAEKGFVMVQHSKPLKYVAFEPKEALDRTKENLETKHVEIIERITKLSDSPILEELNEVYRKGLNLVQPSEMTGTLKGSKMIHRQLNSAFKSAKKDIKVITTEKGFESLYRNHIRALRKANRNGIKVRIIAPVSKNKAAVQEFEKFAEVRNSEGNIGRVYVIDNNHMLMCLTDDNKVHETQDIAFWTNSEHAVESIASPLFNNKWLAK